MTTVAWRSDPTSMLLVPVSARSKANGSDRYDSDGRLLRCYVNGTLAMARFGCTGRSFGRGLVSVRSFARPWTFVARPTVAASSSSRE